MKAGVAEPTVIIACGALAREITQVIHLNNLKHIELVCLPAKLHNTPDQIVPALKEKIIQLRIQQPNVAIFIGYSDCGTGGGIDRLCEQAGIKRLPGAHCYQLYYGTQLFENEVSQNMRTFFLTDFLLYQFDVLVWQGLGLDKYPELRDMYFGHYTTLLYLAQQYDLEKDIAAQEAAIRLGLDYEIRYTGYGSLETSLRQI